MLKSEKIEIAKLYIESRKVQEEKTDALNKLIRTFDEDNQIFGLSVDVDIAFSKAMKIVLGELKMDWIDWWMYECDYGRKPMECCFGEGEPFRSYSEDELEIFLDRVFEE